MALRKLSLLDNPRLVFATSPAPQPGGWPIWDESSEAAASGS